MPKELARNAFNGNLVQIHKVILTPEQRTEGIPESTKDNPYEVWIKGFLMDDEARIGDTVRIRTFIGRQLSGTMVEVNPVYTHDFGNPHLALLAIAIEVEKWIENRRQVGHGK